MARQAPRDRAGVNAKRVLLERLIDHAALFPPASLPMDEALEADRRARASDEAWMLDRFICPATKLAELPADPPRLSVVVDGEPSADPAGLPIELVEARGVAVERLRERFGDDVAVYVELAAGDGLEPALEAVRAAGAGAKLRCGGVTADAFPPVEAVARFVCACDAAGVRWKATAGLHHPIRGLRDGLPMHGFLNLLAAAAFAGAGEDAVAAILAEEDPGAFALDAEGLSVHGRRADPAALAQMRAERLVAYGSCSFAEPVEDLTALGVLPV
jgi:hypothetical protein